MNNNKVESNLDGFIPWTSTTVNISTVAFTKESILHTSPIYILICNYVCNKIENLINAFKIYINVHLVW
jgi:hypothetical protein